LQLDGLWEMAGSILQGGVTLAADPGFQRRFRELEIDLEALAAMELRVLADLHAGATPAVESALLEIRGGEVRQRIHMLKIEALGYYAIPRPDELAAHNEGPVGYDFAAPVVEDWLAGGVLGVDGASELNKSNIARSTLGL
jgi:alkylation response protein AidB-like acyl-CoA dehydrogenase